MESGLDNMKDKLTTQRSSRRLKPSENNDSKLKDEIETLREENRNLKRKIKKGTNDDYQTSQVVNIKEIEDLKE